MGRLYDALDLLLTPRSDPFQLRFRPEDMPDLTLAYRELSKLAQRDGDVGGEYWNQVLGLLQWAEEAHQGSSADDR